MRILFLVSLLLLGSALAAQTSPDLGIAPGVANPNVTQASIKSTICVSGWTKTIRPTASYTNALKRKQMLLDGDTVKQVPVLAKVHPDLTKCVPHSNDPRCYEEDHAIALEDGGHPTDPRNLRPQPIQEARKKDKLETRMNREICSGQVKLVEAQACLKNWKACYKDVFGVAP